MELTHILCWGYYYVGLIIVSGRHEYSSAWTQEGDRSSKVYEGSLSFGELLRFVEAG